MSIVQSLISDHLSVLPNSVLPHLLTRMGHGAIVTGVVGQGEGWTPCKATLPLWIGMKRSGHAWLGTGGVCVRDHVREPLVV